MESVLENATVDLQGLGRSATTAAELGYLSRALKAPRIRAVSGRLAARARDEGWDYEAYLASRRDGTGSTTGSART